MRTKLVNQDPFSNGTEHEVWEEMNCEKCVRGSHYKGEDSDGLDVWTKIKCSIQRDIYTRMCSDEPIAQRTIDACSHDICPYLQTERKRYEKNKGLPKLFEI